MDARSAFSFALFPRSSLGPQVIRFVLFHLLPQNVPEYIAAKLSQLRRVLAQRSLLMCKFFVFNKPQHGIVRPLQSVTQIEDQLMNCWSRICAADFRISSR
jgi:hypothetical protein